jgi:hypothetical protein
MTNGDAQDLGPPMGAPRQIWPHAAPPIHFPLLDLATASMTTVDRDTPSGGPLTRGRRISMPQIDPIESIGPSGSQARRVTYRAFNPY